MVTSEEEEQTLVARQEVFETESASKMRMQ
jgi:hypothetical protein